MKRIEGRAMAELPAKKNDAEFDELMSRERLGIDICKLILGSNGDDLDLSRREMLMKPVVFDSDGLGTQSHLRGVGSIARARQSALSSKIVDLIKDLGSCLRERRAVVTSLMMIRRRRRTRRA
jgi:hypothetical protein